MLIAVVVAILGVYALLSFFEVQSANDRLVAAQADLNETSTKIREIALLSRAPKVAALQVESSGDISNRVAAARAAAGLPNSIVKSEQPGAPTRIPRTDFRLRSTSIELQPVSLPELIRFCDALDDGETGSVVRDLTLTTPRPGESSGNREKWSVQMTLTQMIFSPKSTK
jgi:hypothetical protein